MTSPHKIKVRVCLNMPPFKQGQEFTISCDEYGIPLSKFWRDRLRDSEFDKCIIIENIDEDKESKKVKNKG